ncbi:probable Rho GTPase-activating protein CG5521 [Choristoneura fumiferana]|uniref:probable Rho GTPase-activating protein CG5521 n=1 Tax=Choristoneura fumiferana TaxID=7141 RepID=UPI003D15CF52
MDKFGVLAYIGHTSPEVVCGRRLDAAGPSPLPPGAEDELVCALVAHRNAERQYLAARDSEEELEVAECQESVPASPFASCSLLLAQLGTLAPARRAHAQLLRRSERLLRELRNLDAQRCRETHKVAVIYVGKGQETRNEILSNRCGSPAYEAFLAALAWEVELESHVGFLGGLRVGGGGATAPYVATLTLEALFHVATRMPADSPDAILNKTRHLGNDEVHVVWSEHWRAYKRDTLPTQFCDVLIALYPLPAGLLRCTLTRKPSVRAIYLRLYQQTNLPTTTYHHLSNSFFTSHDRELRLLLDLGSNSRLYNMSIKRAILPETFI